MQLFSGTAAEVSEVRRGKVVLCSAGEGRMDTTGVLGARLRCYFRQVRALASV